MYNTVYQEWPAFTVTGITKIVASGGELYDAVRSDGRWDALRRLGGGDATLYGVASFDKECSQGTYRYTLGVKDASAPANSLLAGDTLFSLPIRQAGWLFFQLDDFATQFGEFWRDDPYQMIRDLGWAFDAKVGLHIDVFPPAFVSEHDPVAFMMPVKHPPKAENA